VCLRLNPLSFQVELPAGFSGQESRAAEKKEKMCLAADYADFAD